MVLTTRKLEASARIGDVVDYTKFRLSRRIIVCPVCGERGQYSGFGVIVHRTQRDSAWWWGPPSQAWKSGCESPTPDHCYLTAPLAASLEDK